MKNVILKLVNTQKKKIKSSAEKREREKLEKKVIEGTDFAIREYRDVFDKLARYDRT